MINISDSALNSIPQMSHLTAKIFKASGNYIHNLWIDDLPHGVEDLDLEGNQIRSDGLLEEWPNTILNLNLSRNPIFSLDQVDIWPTRLVSLNLSYTSLNGAFQSGILPDTLEILNISFTDVSRIHKFPKNLKEFIAVSTNLRILPETCNDSLEALVATQSYISYWGLPNYWGKSLKHLDLNTNRIALIPSNLPETLEFLNLSSNRIQQIHYDPNLPSGMSMCHLGSNRILDIPKWFAKTSTKFTIQNNCLTEVPIIANCLAASYQWNGFKHSTAASSIQKSWRARKIRGLMRSLKRTSLVKWELISRAMHPDRIGLFEDTAWAI